MHGKLGIHNIADLSQPYDKVQATPHYKHVLCLEARGSSDSDAGEVYRRGIVTFM